MKGANNSYFGDIWEGITSLAKGLALTFRHLGESRKVRKNNSVENPNYFDENVGIVTVEYPHEAIPVPDNGRYRLNNEIDDCIVCDLCAKICPVNCIEIEAIKSTEEIGKTSDGSTKRIYAGVFNIDMAKCCYCGLCTTVCPTECLTMTKTYDYSEFDVRNMVYHFSDMTPEKAEEKKREYEEKQKLKAKPAATSKPAVAVEEKKEDANTASADAPVVKKPFKPVIKPAPKKEVEPQSEPLEEKKETEAKSENVSDEVKKEEAPNPVMKKPVMKPVIKKPEPPQEAGSKSEDASSGTEAKSANEEEKKEEAPKPVIKKPIMKPVMKPKPKAEEGDNDTKSQQ